MLKRIVGALEAVAIVAAAAFVVGLFLSPATAKAPVSKTNAVGQAVFRERCAGCHGPTGEGSFGPRLNGGAVVARYPKVEDQIRVVEEGPGAMPAFAGVLTDDEIAAVVEYTREDLATKK